MCDKNYYYVDATLGDDGGDGHYYDPWQTIGKVNGESFNPGDHILFKRGEAWKSSILTIPSSGTVGYPIVFGAYGSGARPIIDRTTRYIDFTLDSDAIYKRGWSGYTVYQVFEDGIRLIKATSKAAMVAGSWRAESGQMYIWSSDSGDPNTHTTEYLSSNSPDIINMNGQSDLIFNSIHTTKGLYGFAFEQISGCKRITMNDCEASWCSNAGFSTKSADIRGHEDLTFSHCVSHDNIAEGFWTGNSTRSIVEYCEAYDIDKDSITKGYPTTNCGTGIMFGHHSIDGICRHNYVHDVYMNWSIGVEHEVTYGERALRTLVEYNRIVLNQLPLTLTVKGLVCQGDSSIVRNNIVQVTSGGAGSLAGAYALWVTNGSIGETFYHNT
jgi:hypothetical protein